MNSGGQSRPLFCFNGGFFTQKQVRRILALSGYNVSFGKPSGDDLIGVWGKSPTSNRGETVASHTGANVVHVEDAFLRSVMPGRSGEPPLGLTIDTQRPYFDSSGPSDLETMLARSPFDDAALLGRARRAIDHLKNTKISKYNDFSDVVDVPAPGYVLVIDQTRDDASIAYGGGNVATFREMLVFAQEEHPGARIVVKTHPDTNAGHRTGHFDASHMGPNMSLFDAPVSPYALLEGAIAVYTVTSGMGFEAILAGHKPIVFGQPFYAGWGLTDDRQPIDRRQRELTRTQLFVGAMIQYPKWYDPFADRLCEVEQVIDTLSARTRAHQEDRNGYSAAGMSRWKHSRLRAFFGTGITFDRVPTGQKPGLVWGAKLPENTEAARVEDGFIRSKGLGAELIPPLSLVVDDLGIYFDATRPSQLETLISQASNLNDYQILRAEKLRLSLKKHALSKYNLDKSMPEIESEGRQVVLVAGQVEDDASIRLGCSDIRTNGALLAQVRLDFPEAYVIFKPHPDVEAGLREGGEIDKADADFIAKDAPVEELLVLADRVATMTSLMGFEALIREINVTCYGSPFYAGWGLTDDRGDTPARRRATPSIDALTHAVLIDYPRYFDPVTGTACPVEAVVQRLVKGEIPEPSKVNRFVAKLQGIFSRFAPIWR